MGVLLFAAIIFHPASFGLYKIALTMSLYAPMLLLALACLIMLLVKRDDPHRLSWALLTGIVLAIFWHVRQEGIVILALLAVYGLIVLTTMGAKRKTKSAAFKELGVLVLVPTLVVLIASVAIKTVNLSKFGVYALDATTAPGFEAANKALLRIRPMPPIRFVTLPREVRQRAYAVSPAFRELESYLEGEGRLWETGATTEGFPIKNEITAGYSMWALIVGTYKAGHDKSARETDQYFHRVADEINAACDDGRLQCRWAFSSFLDPHVQNYLPYLPSSFKSVTSLFFVKYTPFREHDEVSSEVRFIFDEMANRRSALYSPDSLTVMDGWAFSANDKLQRIVVRDRAGKVLASTDQFKPRPDVALAYGKNYNVPVDLGYRLEFPSNSLEGAEIVFIAMSGAEWVVPHTQKLHGVAGTPESLLYAVDSDETFTLSHGPQLRIQNFLGSIYGPITTVLTYLSLGSLLVLVISYRSIDLKDKVYPILALVGAAVLLRVGLFSLIDASSFVGARVHYMFPVLYLYTCILLLLLAQAGRVIVMRLNDHGILQRIDFRTLYKKRPPAESN